MTRAGGEFCLFFSEVIQGWTYFTFKAIKVIRIIQRRKHWSTVEYLVYAWNWPSNPILFCKLHKMFNSSVQHVKLLQFIAIVQQGKQLQLIAAESLPSTTAVRVMSQHQRFSVAVWAFLHSASIDLFFPHWLVAPAKCFYVLGDACRVF